METKEILNECREIVDQVCAKYGYDDNDKEGNDSLKTVLLKAIPAMLKDYSQEERNLFYKMLSHTPIIVTENLTQQSYDDLLEKYIGNNLNQHIIEEERELGEYGRNLGEGAFVSEPILDENMNLKGKKSFIYIQRVNGTAKEFFGTDINVSHLIHELGHAWHSENKQFEMQKDGTLKERIGTAEFSYSFSKTPDNKFIKKCTATTGLMIEEGINTVKEETAMARYMEISLEEMKNAYRETLIPSNYQGYISDLIDYMLQEIGKDNFDNYRLYGDEESKNKINALMEKTEYWKNRETDVLAATDSPRSYDKKRAILEKIDSKSVQDFFSKYENIYFPDISEMTPLEKIDNVLAQSYNMKMIRYKMGIDNYRDFLVRIGYEGYSLINQASDLKNKEVQNEEKMEIIEYKQPILKEIINKAIDNVKEVFKKALGYKPGTKFIIETKPTFKKPTDVEVMKLATIEEKLKKCINENQSNNILMKGITKKEVECLLSWVVQNARENFVECSAENLKESSLLGYCGFGQGLTATTLQNMGLSPNILNVNPTLSNKAGRHAFLTVEFPIKQENGEVKNYPYLVDTTYRQFFLRDEITTSCGEFIKDKRFGNKVAPLPGYWVLQMPKGKEFAETILSNGFIELTEENAKIYGDSFTLEGLERKDNTKVPNKKELITGITGKTYINSMINPVQEEEIDFYEGEIEERGLKVETPLMLKNKLNAEIDKRESKSFSQTKTDIYLDR